MSLRARLTHAFQRCFARPLLGARIPTGSGPGREPDGGGGPDGGGEASSDPWPGVEAPAAVAPTGPAPMLIAICWQFVNTQLWLALSSHLLQPGRR